MLQKPKKLKFTAIAASVRPGLRKAAKSVQGVTKATWNDKDEILTVTFDSAKTTTMKIEDAIAKVGHDTENMKATDKAYNALPGCCKYDRPGSKIIPEEF